MENEVIPSPITRRAFYDEQSDRLVIQSQQDVEPVLGYAEQLRNMGRDGNKTKDGTFYHVAEIPLIVVEQWMKEGVNIFDKNAAKEIKRRLNSPDFSKLRVWDGKL